MSVTTTQSTVVCFGNPFYDRSCYVGNELLEKFGLKEGLPTITDKKSEIDDSWSEAIKNTQSTPMEIIAGSGINKARVLAHLGNFPVAVGRIGSDSEKITSYLDGIGVNIHHLTQGKKPTGTVNCFIHGKQRTFHAYWGVSTEFSEKDVKPEAFEHATHVLFEGYTAYFGKALEEGIALAKERKATISLDLGSADIVKNFKPRLNECIPQVDVLFGNADEMKALTGIESLKEAAELFHPSQIIVATDGESGGWVKDKGHSNAVHYDATKVPEVKDTTAAGDYFNAGFVNGMLSEKPILKCVEMGKLAASFAIQHMGADLPKDKWAELRNLIYKV